MISPDGEKRRVFFKPVLFFSCFYLGDFVIFDRVTIVYFLAVAGPCPRGTGPTLLPTKFHDRRGIVLSPSRRQLGRLFPFPSSLCVVNFPRQFCNHNPLITFHRSPYHRQGRFGPDIPSHPLPDLLVSRAFSFLFSISSCPRREAYFYLQPYASARAAFSTPCRTHERHLTIHSETWSLKASMAVINITSPYYHEYYLDHKSTETRGDKAGMTHDMQEDPDTTEDYKERRAKSLRSRALPSTPLTSTGRSTTSRKSGGGKAGVVERAPTPYTPCHATAPTIRTTLCRSTCIEKRVHRTSSAARSGCAGAMNSSRCAVGDGAVMTGRVCPAGWTGCGILVPVVLGGQYAPRTLRRSVPPCGLLELGWFLGHLNRGLDTESAVINGIESGHTLRVIQNRDRRRLAWGLAPCVPRHKTDAEAAGQSAPAHTIDAAEGDNVT